MEWEDDDSSKEATALRQSLGPKRVHIPKTPDKGDCLVESCCKLLIFARAYGHQVKQLEVSEGKHLGGAAIGDVHCTICLTTWVTPEPHNGQCPECGVDVVDGLPFNQKNAKRKGDSDNNVEKKKCKRQQKSAAKARRRRHQKKTRQTSSALLRTSGCQHR